MMKKTFLTEGFLMSYSEFLVSESLFVNLFFMIIFNYSFLYLLVLKVFNRLLNSIRRAVKNNLLSIERLTTS
jgi:hypothetical protein